VIPVERRSAPVLSRDIQSDAVTILVEETHTIWTGSAFHNLQHTQKRNKRARMQTCASVWNQKLTRTFATRAVNITTKEYGRAIAVLVNSLLLIQI